MKFFLWLLFFVSVVAQVATTLPLFLFALLLAYVFVPSPVLFAAAYGMGIFLDILLLQTIGVSSAMGIGFLFLIFLYERKFEVRTPHFIFLATLFATLCWFFLFYHRLEVFPSLFSAIIVCLVFLLLNKFIGQAKQHMLYEK